jgi:hypothetical protein
MARFVLARLRASADTSGIILPDSGDQSRVLQRAAELLSHLNAAPVSPQDIELLPYFPPERDSIRLEPRAA